MVSLPVQTVNPPPFFPLFHSRSSQNAKYPTLGRFERNRLYAAKTQKPPHIGHPSSFRRKHFNQAIPNLKP